MTRLARLFATTGFKLSAIYLAVFSLFAVSFVLTVSWSIDRLFARQMRVAIATEVAGFAEQGRVGGIRAVINAVERRSRLPNASLYLVADSAGRVLAGNISEVPAGLLDRASEEPLTIPYERDEGATTERRSALVQVVQLPGGLTMLVGRDVAERQAFTAIMYRALIWAGVLLIVLGLISWFFVSRRVLKRVDSVAASSRRIMAGDLHERLEVTGNGDEFDRLAASLNSMLGRIETLLYGLKDVSDNIAHDLKTPLTRLRGRVEATLSGPPDILRYRAALEATIAESDALIRTFNALLLIARIESGAPDGAVTPIDAAEIVRDIAELYEPVAEEAGAELHVVAEGPLRLKANRELMSQVLANLLDNAIKYGRPADPGAKPEIGVRLRRDGDHALVEVNDNGPGVPPSDRERVLQRFVRLEKSRSAPGSGLGLSLVAAAVRLQSGTITLEDNAPGLSVQLRLPLAEAA
ncbi:MAG: ATP-binding protein [Bauldia sp.]